MGLERSGKSVAAAVPRTSRVGSSRSQYASPTALSAANGTALAPAGGWRAGLPETSVQGKRGVATPGF